MKIKIMFIGLMTLLAGVLPLLAHFKILPPQFMLSNTIYAAIIIAVGVFGIVLDFLGYDLFGAQKFVIFLVGLLTIAGGLYPLLVDINLIPAFIPFGNIAYSAVVIVIGLGTLAYGATQF
jgi:hypothetical protein